MTTQASEEQVARFIKELTKADQPPEVGQVEACAEQMGITKINNKYLIPSKLHKAWKHHQPPTQITKEVIVTKVMNHWIEGTGHKDLKPH